VTTKEPKAKKRKETHLQLRGGVFLSTTQARPLASLTSPWLV